MDYTAERDDEGCQTAHPCSATEEVSGRLVLPRTVGRLLLLALVCCLLVTSRLNGQPVTPAPRLGGPPPVHGFGGNPAGFPADVIRDPRTADAMPLPPWARPVLPFGGTPDSVLAGNHNPGMGLPTNGIGAPFPEGVVTFPPVVVNPLPMPKVEIPSPPPSKDFSSELDAVRALGMIVAMAIVAILGVGQAPAEPPKPSVDSHAEPPNPRVDALGLGADGKGGVWLREVRPWMR
jgi:hypothetical protein